MKKIIIISVGSIVFIILASYGIFYGKTTAFSVDTKYSISHNDIDNLYDIEKKMGKIIGSSVIKSKDDVLYNLVITTMQKAILVNNNIKLNKDNALKLFNNNKYKEFYSGIKKNLGEDDYYKIVVEPIAINKLFASFYNKVEPAKRNIVAILQASKSKNLTEIAKISKQKLLNIQINKIDQKLIANELVKLKNKKDKIYKRSVKIRNNLLVLEFNSISDKFINVNALSFKIVSYKEFFKALLPSVKLKFSTLSIYNIKNIHNKKGSIIK